MLVLQMFFSALKSLWSRKLRAFLTMLGVIIGVLSVTLMISIVESASGLIMNEIRAQGSNLLGFNVSYQKPLKNTDIDKFASIDGVAAISPYLEYGGKAIKPYENEPSKDFDVIVQGVSSEYEYVRNMSVNTGRFFSKEEELNSASVCVIGANVAHHLFGTADCIDEYVFLNGYKLKVVGVLKKGGLSFLGDTNKTLIAPHKFVQRKIANIDAVTCLMMSAKTESMIPQVTDGVITLLDKIYNNNSSYYTLISTDSIKDLADEIMGILMIVLASISAISLVVGGIGIMNIMLVSVSERTREIGIQKAIGAKKSVILTQFLFESLVITLLGGLIGVLISWIATICVTAILGITMTIGIVTVLAGMGFSAVVGITFGIYPAFKASCLTPIEALRHT